MGIRRCLKNEYINRGNYSDIIIYNIHSNIAGVVKIDNKVIVLARKYHWIINSGYAISGRTVFLHHIMLPKKKGKQVDHINGDSLDNRRSNLRYTTASQNQWNRQVKGCSYDKSRRNWQAYICVNKKMHWLGRFNSEREAVKARVVAEHKFYGEFSRGV